MSKGFNDFTKGGNKPHDRRNRNNRSSERSPLAYSEVLIGMWNPRNTGETEDAAAIVVANASALREEMASDWDEKAAMSWDGIFRPVSLHGSGGLPRFAQPVTCESCPANTSRGAQPPLSYYTGEGPLPSAYDLVINADYLNPLTNPTDDVYGIQSGHDFDVIARDGDMETGNSAHISSIVTELNGIDPYAEDYRFFALKGPLVIQGWGYDTDGKPIPNAADEEEDAESGIFTTQNLKDQFLDHWLKKSKTWPVGPVDLVWDRTRRVWTTKPAYKMISAVLKEDLPLMGSASAYQNQGSALWDSNGNTIYLDSSNNIIVSNKTNDAYNSGDNIICYWDTDACEYWVLNGYETGDSNSTTTSTTTTLTPVLPTNCTGSCEWISNDGITWTLLSGDCASLPTTTTSTTTSTTSTTTTTTEPGGSTTTSTTTTTIDCNPSFTTTTTTSTTSTTTTTQAPGECQCIKPAFCPTFTGEKITTYCTEYNPGDIPSCTTTTCPPCDCNNYTTTTTTIDPGSTTTTINPCSGNCRWIYVDCYPNGLSWLLIENACPVGSPSYGYCACPAPSSPPTSHCAEFTSECDILPTTTTYDPSGCSGGCTWFYIPQLDRFCLSSYNCPAVAPNGDSCYCPKPTLGEDCGYYSTPCLTRNSTTTTTLAPGSTTTTVDPCWKCCDTGTTTTTDAPCDGGCYYSCVGGSWIKYQDTCDSSCPCRWPTGPCTPGSQLFFICSQGTSTTTTTATPTGACCHNTNGNADFPCGECSILTFAQCQQLNGSWNQGETCEEACPAPCGRCCYNIPWLPSANCQDNVSQDHCNSVFGTWTQGETCAGSFDPACTGVPPVTTTPAPTTTTTTTTLPPTTTTTTTLAPTTTTAGPEGACCNMPWDSCSQQTEINCINGGGTWQGAATDCSVCYAPCTGSCNYGCNEFNQYYLISSNCSAGALIQCQCPDGIIGSYCEGPSSSPCEWPE